MSQSEVVKCCARTFAFDAREKARHDYYYDITQLSALLQTHG